MKKFFKILLRVHLFLGLVAVVLLTAAVFKSWSFSRGQSSVLIAPSRVEIVVVEDRARDFPMHEQKTLVHYVVFQEKVSLDRIKLTYSPFQTGVWFGNQDYVLVPITMNGSYIVLSFSAVSNIVLLGWIFYVAIFATYKQQILKDFKKLKSLFNFKKKQKQV